MYFCIKNYLKNNRYHTVNHPVESHFVYYMYKQSDMPKNKCKAEFAQFPRGISLCL